MPRKNKSFFYYIGIVALLAFAFSLPMPLRSTAARNGPGNSAGAKSGPLRQPAPDSSGPVPSQPTYGKLPITFELNRGQANAAVKFLSRAPLNAAFLDSPEVIFSLPGSATNRPDIRRSQSGLRLRFLNASRDTKPEGEGVASGRVNYLIGKHASAWLTNIPSFTRVVYREIYPGVDLAFYGKQDSMEYDLVVSEGADPGRIRLQFQGANGISLGKNGELVLKLRSGELRQTKPIAYQIINGAQKLIDCGYRLSKTGEIGFSVADYDRTHTLVIDPTFIYSTFLGGSGNDSANAIAIDNAGNAYVAGTTDSLNFPTTAGARSQNLAGGTDAFVTKLSADGSNAIYSTYIGGGNNDVAFAIAVDANGNAFVSGSTTSSDFPVSAAAFDSTCGATGTCSNADRDAFVLKLNSTGSDLIYSTYLGGSGVELVDPQSNYPNALRMGLAVDSQGSAYVTGSTTSQDFPTTAGAFQTSYGSSFITKLDPAGSALTYSSYFPGAIAQAIALDSDGNAYITGMAGDASNAPKLLPVVNAYQPSIGGLYTFDAFFAKLNSWGSGLLFSSFLGGPEGAGDTPRGGDDVGYGIGVDQLGNVYVSGTSRSGCFPTSSTFVPPASCSSGSGGPIGFVTKFAPGGNTMLYSKRLPASSTTPLSVSPAGIVYVASGGLHVYKLAPDGQLLFTTHLGGSNRQDMGGITHDDAGDVYLAGRTLSSDFPTTAGAFQTTFRGGQTDAFVTRLSTSFGEAQFAADSLNCNEDQHAVQIQIDRLGNLAGDFTVDYATSDGTASDRSDYTAAAGTLHFAPGELSKTIHVYITDDAFGPEGLETFKVDLGNPTQGASLNTPSTVIVRIADNDTSAGTNPVNLATLNPDFFVRQHYVDFLNREPDADGFAFWRSQLNQCGSDLTCLDLKRINVSAAFFLSIEFQETGYFVYRLYKTAYGDATSPQVAGTVPVVRLNQFLPDAQKVGHDVMVGPGNWQQQLDNNKTDFSLEFVQRPNFVSAFPASLTADQFVAQLDQNAGGVLSASERDQLVSELGPTPADLNKRAAVLKQVAENALLRSRELNRAFVLMEYFGYLRRNPNDAPDGDFRGWKFWLDKLNQFDGNFVNAEMVKAFIVSDEYRHRFGP